VASERVHQEWFALLAAPDCALALRSLEQHGVLACLLPGLASGGGQRVAALEPVLADCRKHSWMAAWLAEPERLELVRFAALLQPHGQGPADGEVVARFALSRAQRRALAAMRQPLAPPSDLLRDLSAWLLRHGRDGLGAVLLAAVQGGLRWSSALACLEQEVLPRLAEKPLVTGDDLQQSLGAPPSPAFKAALAAARLEQLTGAVTTSEAALAVARQSLVEG
jgi:tRNA nucleotidyltransferase/poly(A) polymerase